jgi:hypothetical protein
MGAIFVFASLLGVGYLLTGKAVAGTLLVAVSLGAGALAVRSANANTGETPTGAAP